MRIQQYSRRSVPAARLIAHSSLSTLCVLAAALPTFAATLVVRPGESIRAALARARAGDTIEVMPGVYHEGTAGELNALTITLDRISLVGRPRVGRPVVLENAGGQSFGIWVSPANSAGPVAQGDPEHPPCGLDGATLRDFSIHGFTVRGFAQDGVHLACVDGFSISGNRADGNAVYGLFPVASRSGIIAGNTVTNTASDAGIYVGQSDHVLITGNVARQNELGVEVENSRDCSVLGNEVSGNTVGIVADLLPFLERKTQNATLVAFNSVHDNNRPNAADPGDLLGVLPSGVGVLVVGGRATTVTGNSVRSNGFTGIAVASLCLARQLQGMTCDGLDIDPDPRQTRIVGNRLVANGTVPQANPFFDGLRADLIWDGSGSDNCWSDNRFSTSTPPALPACP